MVGSRPAANSGRAVPGRPVHQPGPAGGASAALDDNTPEALRYFLEVGRYEAA
ncbi:hypothetical protein ACWCXC_00830 [Streptomyces sp. NPDC001515]